MISSFFNGNQESILRNNIEVIINAKSNLRNRGQSLCSGDYSLYEHTYTYNFVKPSSIQSTISLVNQSLEGFFNLVKDEISTCDKQEGNLLALTKDIYQFQKLSEKLQKVTQLFPSETLSDSESKSLDEIVNSSKEKSKELINSFQSSNIKTNSIPEFNFSSDIQVQRNETLSESNLEKYIETYSSSLKIEQVKEMISEGSKLYQSIISNERASLPEEAEKAQLELGQLTWFFMHCAIEKSEGYNEGAFMIEDPQNRLFNFINSSGHSYKRASSHLKNRSFESHYGVDVFNNLMPANKRALLSASVHNMDGQSLLFLKPENFSAHPLNVYDSIMRSKELLASQYNKRICLGSDTLPNMRKELLPENIINKFKPIALHVDSVMDQISGGNRPISETSVANHKAKSWGIAYMFRNAKEISDVFPKTKKIQLSIFIEYIKLINFIKDYRANFNVIDEKISMLIETLVEADNPYELVWINKINPNELFKTITEDFKFPEELKNRRLSQIIDNIKNLEDCSDLTSCLTYTPTNLLFISLVEFYASLEAMDHLENRMGREVYLSSNELIS